MEAVLLDGVGGLGRYSGMSLSRAAVEGLEMMIEHTSEDMLIER